MKRITPDQALKQLAALGNEGARKQNAKRGAGDNQFGAKLGDIRALAKTIKQDHVLAMALWKTGNIDARLLAILIMEPKALSSNDLDRLVRSIDFVGVADWFNSYIAKNHPDNESLRRKWMADEDPMAARAGWQLTAGRIAKNPDGLDLDALLDRIETDMGSADPVAQWTMNCALAEIGIHHPRLRDRAVAIGEKLGLYRDYPVSKGCTSPFAPIWINEMVKRRG